MLFRSDILYKNKQADSQDYDDVSHYTTTVELKSKEKVIPNKRYLSGKTGALVRNGCCHSQVRLTHKHFIPAPSLGWPLSYNTKLVFPSIHSLVILIFVQTVRGKNNVKIKYNFKKTIKISSAWNSRFTPNRKAETLSSTTTLPTSL